MQKKTKKMIEAMKKVPGSEGSFNPVHRKQQHGEDPNSPNQYTHKVSEAVSTRGTASSLGGEHNPKRSAFKSNLLHKYLINFSGYVENGVYPSL